MIKLVAFDWNGTLLADTNPSLKASNEVFKIYGLKPINITGFRQTFTIPIKKMWENNGLKKEIDFLEQSKTFHPIYEKYAAHSRTRHGTRTLLMWLENHRIKQMIYSNHIAPDIIKQLMRLNIFEYFDEVLARSANDHSHTLQKNKEQKLYDYVKRNKLRPKEIITVGDTEEEIEIGKAAGFYTVGITGGYNTTARLKKQKPDFLINNMLELKRIIQKLNKI